jgi:general secretion pathway protein C
LLIQNIRYHLINTGAVILFSFITALSISQFIRLSISPAYSVSSEKEKYAAPQAVKKSFDEYKAIIDSNFFKIASETDKSKDSGGTITPSASDLNDLQLLGTISGPAAIARILLRKKQEKDSQIFKLWDDVYGYKLVRIDNFKIYLKRDKNVLTLDMYPKDDKAQLNASAAVARGGAAESKTVQALSRSEIQQKLLNNVDNALEGLQAGPNRVNGKIDGYRLARVSPNNFLYKLGARSGDIAKRINGHPIDSTEKLLGLWQSLQGESKITVDIDRGGKIQTFEFNVTD